MTWVDIMAKMTKAQAKNALRSIQNKATKLCLVKGILTVADVGAINRILAKADNRLKKM